MTFQEQFAEKYKCAKDPIYFLNNYGFVFDAVKKKIDRMQCFPYQEKCVRDFDEFQNNIVLKSRQCLPGDTFVDTPDGPKAIQDFKIGDLVYSYNLETNEVEMDTIADAWCSGERQCVKLKLKDSRNVEVGENHPFWVVNKQEWIKAKDLSINDEILDANIGFGEVRVNEDEVKLLSYLITDGCINKQVKFTNNSIDYLEEFETSVYSCFPELEIRKSPKLNGYDYFPHQKHGTNIANPIMEWCETKGIANKKTEFKNLPEEVFYWDKKSVSLLINRIFAGDGWISILKKNDNKRLEIGLGSPSLIFLEQVKSLLKKYNIKGNIYEVKNMKLQQNKFYKLRITHSKSISTFINEIGIYKKIKPEHLEIISNRKNDVKNTSKVRKIEITDVKKCYDISVTKNENFLINGLLVHNTGLSVITAGYAAWRLMFRYDERILVIANDATGAERFLETVKQFISMTPKWLQPDQLLVNNTRRIAFSNGSWMQAKASSPDAGRGDSLTMLILDETAFIKDDQDIWMGAGMALSATKGKCIMISTPNGTGNLYHKTWVQAVNKDNDFNALTVHWTQNPQSSNGLKLIKNASGEEVPWSPWYEEQCKRLNWDSVKIAQELDLSFEGSKRLAVDPELVAKYKKKHQQINPKPICYLRFDYIFKDELEKAASFILDETNFYIYKKPEEDKKYIVACLPTGEKVLTDSGLKNIEDVNFNDKLINKDGNEVEIKNIQKTSNIDDFIYEIRPSNTFRKTKFTSNHPILACSEYKLKRNYNPNHETYKFNERYWDLNYDFKNASDLKIGDWLIYPNIYLGKDKSLDYIKNKFESYNVDLRQDFVIDSKISIDEEFWWFVGIWLAEGWTQKYDEYDYLIATTHNLKTELNYVERIQALFEKYGRKITVTPNLYDNSIKTQFNSKQIFNFLVDNFGKYAHGKKISEWVKFLPENFKLKIIEGYLNGDGSWFKDSRRKNSTMSFVSVSLELLESIQDILFSLGIISNLSLLRYEKEIKIKDKIIHQKETYQLTLCHYDSILLADKFGYKHDFKCTNKRIIKDCFLSKDKKFIHFRIKDINKIRYKGEVYNFETETHTFLCKNITTHNCDVARGDGSDYSTIQILDVETLEQVAEYREKVGVDLFPYLINFVARYYNEAYVVVEANSFGLGVGYDMRDKFNYRKLFYSKNVQDIHVRPYDFKVAEGVDIPGFQTTPRTKPMIVKALIEHMREGSLIINSPRLLAELETFIAEGTKLTAEKGFNDDLIMAICIALYIRDTEYQNVSMSNNMYKSMISAIGFNATSASGKVVKQTAQGEPDPNKKDLDFKGTGIFLSNNLLDDENNDLGWLLK